MTLITTIVPCFNQSVYLAEAIESVLGQTYSNWECIIVNDGSTDDTETVATALCRRDSRIRYARKSNGGLSSARNMGLRIAKGNWIQFLDADDVIEPTKFEQHFHQIQASNYADNLVMYCDYKYGNHDNIRKEAAGHIDRQFKSNEYLRELIIRWEHELSIPPHCFLMNSRFFIREGITFDESLPNHEDLDCWLRIFRLNPTIQYIDQKLCLYRLSAGSMSRNMALMGEGFLQLLDQHIASDNYSPSIRKLFLAKRRRVLKTYNRIDRMAFSDKLILSGHLSRYYCKRILQKTGLVP